jgi:hypothetical protein
VLEANFRPNSPYERRRIAELCERPVEVYCACPADEAARRYAARNASPAHHIVHPMRELAPDFLAEFNRPVGIGHVIEVDTTTPVDIPALAQQVRAAFDS